MSVELGDVGPSRFHGASPPQLPFPTWREWPYSPIEPGQRMPPRSPDTDEMLRRWWEQWMRDVPQPGRGVERPERYL